MKDININVSAKLSIIVGAVILLIYGGLIGFAYKEMSSMRRDLYAVRADYYGIYNPGKAGTLDNSPVDIEILNQETKELRAFNNNAAYDVKAAEAEPFYNYTKQPIKEVKVKVTNKEDYIVSLNSYNFGYINQTGQIIRSIDVHPEDNKNDPNTYGFGMELTKDGSGELYVYFTDDGSTIDKLVYLQ